MPTSGLDGDVIVFPGVGGLSKHSFTLIRLELQWFHQIERYLCVISTTHFLLGRSQARHNQGRIDPLGLLQEIILISLLCGKRLFQELNFDACGQGSNSNLSASFLVQLHSSATVRVSDKAAEVDGICSHGLCEKTTTEMVVWQF